MGFTEQVPSTPLWMRELRPQRWGNSFRATLVGVVFTRAQAPLFGVTCFPLPCFRSPNSSALPLWYVAPLDESLLCRIFIHVLKKSSFCKYIHFFGCLSFSKIEINQDYEHVFLSLFRIYILDINFLKPKTHYLIICNISVTIIKSWLF